MDLGVKIVRAWLHGRANGNIVIGDSTADRDRYIMTVLPEVTREQIARAIDAHIAGEMTNLDVS